MFSTMGNITKLAFNNLENSEHPMSASEILEYLQHDELFKSLSEQLKETMFKIGLCDNNSSDKDYINILFDSLQKQFDDCHMVEKSFKNTKKITIKRWIEGNTKSIRDRYDVIKICFALSLDYELATILLNKCGFHGFNVKNIQDATYLYCILNNRPLSSALKILQQYYSDNVLELIKESNTSYNNTPSQNKEQQIDKEIQNNDITVFLEQSIGTSHWKNDDDFLKNFLIPNREKFIGYSITALKEYYFLKNYSFINVFLDIYPDNFYIIEEKIFFPENNIQNGDFSFSISFKNALKKYENSIFFNKYNKILDNDMRNIKKILCEIKKLISEKSDFDSQKIIADFINDVMSEEAFLKYVIRSIISNEGRIRSLRNNKNNVTNGTSIKDTVMEEFPKPKTFSNIEYNLSAIHDGKSSRKAIILMYYIAYAYEFSSYISDYNFLSDRFGEMGFSEFIEGLNTILTKCKLSPLYPANQFDWLILRSIREFEVFDLFDADDNPIKIFNDVIEIFFDKTPNDDEV